MLSKKIVSLGLSVGLVVSQLAVASSMAGAPAPSITPELTLVTSVLALQGEDLSSSASQQQVTNAISQYLASAPQAGQQQRLAQALVDVGVYTPEQAQSYVADAQAVAAKGGSQAEIKGEIQQLARLHPAGAQFSAYDLLDCRTAYTAGIVGVVAVIVGAVIHHADAGDPSCSTPIRSKTTNSNGTTTVTYGETTCTDTSYPYGQAGNDLMIYGGVLAAVGGLIMFMGDNDGC